MAREIFSSAPVSGVAPFLRTCQLGWRLVCHVSALSVQFQRNPVAAICLRRVRDAGRSYAAVL